MGIDRFVYWKTVRPTFDEVRDVLEDYLGEACTLLNRDGPRLTARLVGKPRFPLRRLPDHKKYAPSVEVHDERWFEVFVDAKYVDVITRQTDEFTNNVAEGFAELCRRVWKGKRDPG